MKTIITNYRINEKEHRRKKDKTFSSFLQFCSLQDFALLINSYCVLCWWFPLDYCGFPQIYIWSPAYFVITIIENDHPLWILCHPKCFFLLHFIVIRYNQNIFLLDKTIKILKFYRTFLWSNAFYKCFT